jgi:hypothetical protein
MKARDIKAVLTVASVILAVWCITGRSSDVQKSNEDKPK